MITITKEQQAAKPKCPEWPHFGATYPDACCIDGELWDLDHYDGMTKEQILQGNKLIAEFLGWKFILEDNAINAYFNDEKRWIDTPKCLNELLLSQHGFCFNSDWNRLMEAWKKFYETVLHTEWYTDFYDDESSGLQDIIEYCLLPADILEFFKYFVKFIHWYNSLPTAQECGETK